MLTWWSNWCVEQVRVRKEGLRGREGGSLLCAVACPHCMGLACAAAGVRGRSLLCSYGSLAQAGEPGRGVHEDWAPLYLRLPPVGFSRVRVTNPVQTGFSVLIFWICSDVTAGLHGWRFSGKWNCKSFHLYGIGSFYTF